MLTQDIYNKNASTVIKLAKVFLFVNEGERIPTYEQLANDFKVARGTIQLSMRLLEHRGAIKLRARGHLGTFLIEKDMSLLLELADYGLIYGAMTLPSTRENQGLATAIITEVASQYGVIVNLSYTPRPERRMEMLVNGRCDFVVTSKYYYEKGLRDGLPIELCIDLGPHSYRNEFVIAFNQEHKTEIENGMKVAYATNGKLQNRLTDELCENKDVTYIPLTLDEIIPALTNNIVDATVWAIDEFDGSRYIKSMVALDPQDDDLTTAVVIVKNDRQDLKKLIQQHVDRDKVLAVQKEVLEYKVLPRY